MTDHDWMIDQVSNDIERILGCRPESYKGSSLLGLLRPVEAQKFIMAVDGVTSEGLTLRTHLRAHGDNWREVLCLVTAMCRHSPPRLGLAFVARPDSSVELAAQLHQQPLFSAKTYLTVWFGLGCTCLLAVCPRGSGNLNRLVLGERAQDVAAALYLSPSTVRNHLTAIYKKFGVHSQAELLAQLLQTLG